MKHGKFKHVDPDVFHGRELSLHDCIADQIVFEDNTLRFFMPDGIWVTQRHPGNDSQKVVRTDAAAVSFYVEELDDIILRVFTRNKWCWAGKTIVEIWEMDRLIACVNSGKCILEFITQYRTYGEQMWHCAIRSNRKPYYRECQIYLPGTDATYYWNDICPDREW